MLKCQFCNKEFEMDEFIGSINDEPTCIPCWHKNKTKYDGPISGHHCKKVGYRFIDCGPWLTKRFILSLREKGIQLPVPADKLPKKGGRTLKFKRHSMKEEKND